MRESVVKFLLLFSSALVAYDLFTVLNIPYGSGPVSHWISPPTYKKMFPNAVCSENMKAEALVLSLITDENKMLLIRVSVLLLDLDISHKTF